MMKNTISILLLLVSSISFSQETIITSVPFLSISPDAKATSLGNTGVATLDVYSASHWNPSKYALSDQDAGAMFSYVPNNNISSLNLSYLSGFYKTSPFETIAMSLKYFNADEMLFANQDATITGNYTPKEFSIDVSYARRLTRFYNVGLTVRYIHSSMIGTRSGGASLKGNAIAADIGILWSNPDLNWFGNSTTFNWGISITNIGSKMIYNSESYLGNNNYIPTTFKYGVNVIQEISHKNFISFSCDLTKLLVPTSDPNDPNYINSISMLEGYWKSLTYAPGGLSSKLQEVIWSVGLEYDYDGLVSFRTGYYFDHPNKGNKQLFTFGGGVTLGDFILDTSYSIPVGKTIYTNNSIQFSLIFKTNNIFRKPNYYDTIRQTKN